MVDSGLVGASTLLAPRNWFLSAACFVSSRLAFSGAIAPRQMASLAEVDGHCLNWSGRNCDVCFGVQHLVRNFAAAARHTIDRVLDPIFVWSSIFYVALYWVLLLDKLRTTSSPDARRRLQVLLAGSVVGLGSVPIIFGLLPYLGIADPNDSRWLLFLVIVLMLFFPLTLAYVVIVQRAMDVPILLRMGSKYLLASTTVKILRIAGIAALIWFVGIPLFIHHHKPTTTAFWVAVLLLFGFLFLKKRSPTDLLQEWIDRKFFREAFDSEVMLSQLAKTAQTISDPAALIRTVSHRVSDVLHVERLTVLLCSNGSFEPAYTIGPAFAAPVRALDHVLSSTPIFNSANEGRTSDTQSPELLLPLPGRTQLLGAMALGPKRSEAPYTPSDLRLLESVSIQTGLGLELSEAAASLAAAAVERERIAREMEIAREVQERLFPQRLPALDGVNLAGACRTVFGVGVIIMTHSKSATVSAWQSAMSRAKASRLRS